MWEDNKIIFWWFFNPRILYSPKVSFEYEAKLSSGTLSIRSPTTQWYTPKTPWNKMQNKTRLLLQKTKGRKRRKYYSNPYLSFKKKKKVDWKKRQKTKDKIIMKFSVFHLTNLNLYGSGFQTSACIRTTQRTHSSTDCWALPLEPLVWKVWGCAW